MITVKMQEQVNCLVTVNKHSPNDSSLKINLKTTANNQLIFQPYRQSQKHHLRLQS